MAAVAWRMAVAGSLALTVASAGGCGRMWDKVRGKNTPVKLAARLQSDSADQRVQGINGLADRDFGLKPPYTDRYVQLAKADPDYLARATAIRALNRARLKEATPIFIDALADENTKIRLEAAKALANIPDENAVAPLLAVLTKADEDKDVRIAAADALRHYKRLDVARALAATLSEREFSVGWQSHRTLRRMLGIDLRYTEAAWLEYFVGPQNPFG
jgi:HEAT repeat protein